jgi:thiosulfate/3-mercaptopyruvate sulfurtransferase
MKKLIYLIVAVLMSVALNAQKISVADLSKILDDPNVVVIDCRKSADYLKTHIKGAVNLDVTTLCNNTPIEGILKDKNAIATILGASGISATKTVIVYCETGVRAGRFYWILKYMGVKDVRMLDGQMDAWFAGRKPITKVATTPTAVTFTPAVNSSIKVDKAYVQSKLNASGTIIVDTRKKEDYDAGHIGNAVNICHELLLSGKMIKANTELTTIFNNAGVTSDKEVILYCKTSTTAGLAYFILSSLLNYKNVKIYDGAYLEWSN